MSIARRDDAGFRWTESGQDYLHYLGAKLRDLAPAQSQIVHRWNSADLTTVRVVAIGSGVEDLSATVVWDGNPWMLQEMLAAGRRGATIEYFPALSSPSESYSCILVSAGEVQLAPDPDFWWEYRYQASVTLRRIDGGSWRGLISGTLFYYQAGNDLPGLTFTRSGTVGPYVDENGVVQSAAADIFRTSWRDTTGNNVLDTPYLLLARALTNALDSDDLTAWTQNGTPQVATTDGPDGGASSAYTVEDDDGAATEYIERIVPGLSASPSNKGVSFTIRENTMPASGNQQLIVRDVTAAADRLLLNITGWVAGQPQITAVTGALLDTAYVGNGYWIVTARTTSLTVANSNRVRLVPAATAAQTGILDVYRVNVFDEDYPDAVPYDASETKNAEEFEATFQPTPRSIIESGGVSIYLKMLEVVGSDMTGSPRRLNIGGSSAGDPRLLIFDNGTRYRGLYDDGTDSSQTPDSTLTQTLAGQEVELLLTVTISGITGTVELQQSIDGGAIETATAPSGASFDFESFAEQVIHLNSAGAANYAHALYQACKVAEGVKTMAEMRAL